MEEEKFNIKDGLSIEETKSECINYIMCTHFFIYVCYVRVRKRYNRQSNKYYTDVDRCHWWSKFKQFHIKYFYKER